VGQSIVQRHALGQSADTLSGRTDIWAASIDFCGREKPGINWRQASKSFWNANGLVEKGCVPGLPRLWDINDLRLGAQGYYNKRFFLLGL